MILKLDFGEKVAANNQYYGCDGAKYNQVGCYTEIMHVDKSISYAVNAVR